MFKHYANNCVIKVAHLCITNHAHVHDIILDGTCTCFGTNLLFDLAVPPALSYHTHCTHAQMHAYTNKPIHLVFQDDFGSGSEDTYSLLFPMSSDIELPMTSAMSTVTSQSGKY